ncbi:MAG: PaaI family thioesterase [Actinomycetota bacterium]|nr:PaaI family thioesterase [Actinomycetota bacterium]
MTDVGDDLRALVASSAFYRWSGIRVADAVPGTVTLELDLDEHHRNVQGFAHGGVLATLADAAMGLSVRTALEPGRRHVTIELGVHYLRPVTSGTVTATGSAIRVGREVAYAEAVVADAAGGDVARASGTYSVTRRRS